MSKLNYHHLYYFWRVAKQGNLTKTAEALHISQSALSAQIRQLEATMGVELFVREGRQLRLTESGQSALVYAEEIFKRGEELESLLSKGIQPELLTVRIGVLTTMSRNFVESFIEPLIRRPNTKYMLHARGQVNLLNAVANHEFDLALTNIQVLGTNKELWQCQLLARQPVAIVGPPDLPLGKAFSSRYKDHEWVVPVSESPVRSAFDSFCAQHQFKPRIVAEADDMAMLRLLARDTGALAVMPNVVVKDELLQGRLVNYLTLPNVYENFYAVTVKRQIQNQLVSELINSAIKT
ncbi:LysR family transcriptional regulator [Cellvibrio fontiphilus]|uniref:LysR family transcriptional regulator n=1 Tax=Cellvibrio fontiphilus TaxID=1815559 RepID=A0ABV7FFK6_9GAMM